MSPFKYTIPQTQFRKMPEGEWKSKYFVIKYCSAPLSSSHKQILLQRMFKKSKEIADDKVNIAVNTYEMIDKHIRKLDSDLAKFESEMKVIIDWSKALLSSSVVNILPGIISLPWVSSDSHSSDIRIPPE